MLGGLDVFVGDAPERRVEIELTPPRLPRLGRANGSQDGELQQARCQPLRRRHAGVGGGNLFVWQGLEVRRLVALPPQPDLQMALPASGVGFALLNEAVDARGVEDALNSLSD